MQTYHDPDLQLSLQLPEGWETTHIEPFALVLLAPPQDLFRPNITFRLKSLSSATPEEFDLTIRAAQQEHQMSYKDYMLLESNKFFQDGFPAYFSLYHWTADHTDDPLSQFFVLILRSPERLYSIYGSMLRPQEASFLPIIQDIIRSISFSDDNKQD
ncbi:hypothetical protein MASR2M15_28610 [Anaerolineales bacterium]